MPIQLRAAAFTASAVRSSILVPDFFSGAAELRAYFEQRFASPAEATTGRFVWDYWHVPDQYTYIRTIAEHFFPPELYRAFVDHLRSWGRDTLGCATITAPWLSYYVDGCVQELHADVPHGPWAYVFSITNWESRRFSGGETLLLRPESLDFWRGFDPQRSLEADGIEERLPPRFNQLTIFDARVPHGVRMVHGVREPRDGRIVLHGWFRQPDTTINVMPEDQHALAAVKREHARLEERLAQFEGVAGTLTIRLDFGSDGHVRRARALSDTLVSTDGRPSMAQAVLEAASEMVDSFDFPDGPRQGWAILALRLPVGMTELAG